MAEINKGKQYNLESNSIQIIKNTSLIVAISLFISTIVDIAINLSMPIIALTIVSAFIFSLVYLFALRKKITQILKLSVTIISQLLINTTWFLNYGFEGPTFYMFLVFIAFVTFVWNGRPLIIILSIIGANIATILLIEYYNPELLPKYPSDTAELLDNYLGLLVASVFITYYTLVSKKNYTKQYQKARESDELKSIFMNNMSHEIRTPLNSIVGFSELIADPEASDSDRIKYAGVIEENSKSLTNLVNNILDISNIESNQLSIKIAPFNIATLLVRLKNEYNNTLTKISKDHIELNLSVNDYTSIIESDEYRVEQIIRNLVENAIKFTFEGEIRIVCDADNEKVKVKVIDTGIGIKKEYHIAIFERFTKIEGNLTTLFRGTGIGLFLVSEILEILDGSVTVESELGKGSIFEVTLPLKTQSSPI